MTGGQGPASALVAVYVRQLNRWMFAGCEVSALGDYDWEADEIMTDLDLDYAFSSPVIVVHDPSGNFAPGCSTNSHWTPEDDIDRHADCTHGREFERVLYTATNGEQW